MALVLREKLSNLAEYAIWKIEETADFFIPQLIFSEWEQKYYDGIAHPARKLQWLASRYLLKQLMGTDTFVELLFDSDGKPYISNFDINLSLSHSSGYAAAIISTTSQVGIDIEEPHRNIERLKHKFLSPAEIENIDDEGRMQKLLLYWSAKEVIYKIYGKRKLEFKDDMFIKPFKMQNRGQITGMLMKNGLIADFNMHYIQHEQFVFVAGVEEEVSVLQS